jgi:HPt (histidine-containing phosphotransfer) domain-containing protein
MASVTPVITDAATLEEVMDVLEEHVPIQMEGDFQPETLFEILIHAASNAESIEQTCKTLEDTPTSNDVRYHLNKLENMEELEDQLNQALRSRVPGRLQNRCQKLVIDLKAYALIPYYGVPSEEEKPYIIRSQAKEGTSSFYAYATGIPCVRHLPRQTGNFGLARSQAGGDAGLRHHTFTGSDSQIAYLHQASVSG